LGPSWVQLAGEERKEERRIWEGGRRKEEGGRREGGRRRKEEGGRRKEEGGGRRTEAGGITLPYFGGRKGYQRQMHAFQSKPQGVLAHLENVSSATLSYGHQAQGGRKEGRRVEWEVSKEERSFCLAKMEKGADTTTFPTRTFLPTYQKQNKKYCSKNSDFFASPHFSKMITLPENSFYQCCGIW
jgi:hypothetical protein